MKTSLKNLLLAISSALLFNQSTSAQVTFTSWAHPPEITLYASVTGAGIATSATVSLDDIYSPVIPLGFTFNYFGIPYTQCVIGANGTIGFDTSQHDSYDPWDITAPLLGNANKYNCICGPWCDMDMFYLGTGADGELTYFTYGTAPNRQFVVNYCHNSMYSCPDQHTTAQIILYESTDVIETHIGNKTVCATWNAGYAVVGVQSNSVMATAVTAPGRDYPSVWIATNEAWQFTPSGATYTVASIPYASIPYYTVYWFDSTTGAALGSGDSIVLTPPAPTTYKAVAISCADSATTGLDTVGTGYMFLMPITSTGTSELVSTQKLSLYPNPAFNELNVTADGLITEVTICDLLGQAVLTLQNNSNHAKLNIATLPPGVYLVKINGSAMRRFVKE